MKTIPNFIDPTREFFGTKRDLESRRRIQRGQISYLPRWRSLSMDHTVYVDSGGSVRIANDDGRFVIIVAQCIPV